MAYLHMGTKKCYTSCRQCQLPTDRWQIIPKKRRITLRYMSDFSKTMTMPFATDGDNDSKRKKSRCPFTVTEFPSTMTSRCIRRLRDNILRKERSPPVMNDSEQWQCRCYGGLNNIPKERKDSSSDDDFQKEYNDNCRCIPMVGQTSLRKRDDPPQGELPMNTFQYNGQCRLVRKGEQHHLRQREETLHPVNETICQYNDNAVLPDGDNILRKKEILPSECNDSSYNDNAVAYRWW